MTNERCDSCGARLGGPRYPLQPLAALFPGESVRQLCGRLKVSGSTYEAYACHGMLAKTADMVAARAGVPAYSVWPEMVDELIAMSQLQCVECGEGFVPRRYRTEKFCSKRCCGRRVAREWDRRKRREDPEFRERERARKAAYYREVRGYAVRWQREYRQRTNGDVA